MGISNIRPPLVNVHSSNGNSQVVWWILCRDKVKSAVCLTWSIAFQAARVGNLATGCPPTSNCQRIVVLIRASPSAQYSGFIGAHLLAEFRHGALPNAVSEAPWVELPNGWREQWGRGGVRGLWRWRPRQRERWRGGLHERAPLPAVRNPIARCGAVVKALRVGLAIDESRGQPYDPHHHEKRCSRIRKVRVLAWTPTGLLTWPLSAHLSALPA